MEARRAAAETPTTRPACHSCSMSASCAGVPTKMSASLRYSSPARSSSRRRRVCAACGVSSRNTTTSPKRCKVPRLRPAPHCSALISPTISAACAASCGVTNPTSALPAIKSIGPAAVAQGGDNRLALWWARRNRGSFDGEPAALEVDVVQLVPVDEPSRWRHRGSQRRPPSCPTNGAAPQRNPRSRRIISPSISGSSRRPNCAAVSGRAAI